ncbi:uncharacterized protein LOC115065231 [Mus pahari]|uniref:uncharacterized protein LOC115065231 n=1 Tax=Mus pahari TaxID=10093 RepID=UPI001114ACFD|nr:uncharacterized protein LOC115065231 [Mus pahari]
MPLLILSLEVSYLRSLPFNLGYLAAIYGLPRVSDSSERRRGRGRERGAARARSGGTGAPRPKLPDPPRERSRSQSSLSSCSQSELAVPRPPAYPRLFPARRKRRKGAGGGERRLRPPFPRSEHYRPCRAWSRPDHQTRRRSGSVSDLILTVWGPKMEKDNRIPCESIA